MYAVRVNRPVGSFGNPSKDPTEPLESTVRTIELENVDDFVIFDQCWLGIEIRTRDTLSGIRAYMWCEPGPLATKWFSNSVAQVLNNNSGP